MGGREGERGEGGREVGEREGEKYSPSDSLGLKHCCYSRAWKEPFRWSHFCRHSVSQMLMKSVYFVDCFAPDFANSQTAFHILRRTWHPHYPKLLCHNEHNKYRFDHVLTSLTRNGSRYLHSSSCREVWVQKTNPYPNQTLIQTLTLNLILFQFKVEQLFTSLFTYNYYNNYIQQLLQSLFTETVNGAFSSVGRNILSKATGGFFEEAVRGITEAILSKVIPHEGSKHVFDY